MYNNLVDPLKTQLKTLDENLGESHKIRRIVRDLYKNISKNEIKNKSKRKKVARRMAFLEIKVRKLLSEKYMNFIHGYNDSGETINFQKMLHEDDHVRVMSGISLPSNTAVVSKWYKSKRKTIQFEIDIYNRMKQLGAPLLQYSTKFKVMNDPLLVMEKLENLTGEEDEFELGKQVLQQLQYLHTFTVHNDLKPGNIMKKITPESTSFYLIDFGGCASLRLSYGYKRSCWTPYYCSQSISKKEKQITTAKSDLIELGFTMKGLQNMRNGNYKKVRFGDKKKGDDPIRTGFEGKLAAYIDRCNLIDETKIVKKDYDDLLLILQS